MTDFGKRLYRGWTRFAHAIGAVNSAVVFAVIFYVVLGLYALPLRLIRLFSRKRTTAWERKPAPVASLEELRRQF